MYISAKSMKTEFGREIVKTNPQSSLRKIYRVKALYYILKLYFMILTVCAIIIQLNNSHSQEVHDAMFQSCTSVNSNCIEDHAEFTVTDLVHKRHRCRVYIRQTRRSIYKYQLG